MATFHEIKTNPPDPEEQTTAGVKRAWLALLAVLLILPLPYATRAMLGDPEPCADEAVSFGEEGDPCCGKRCLLGLNVDEMILWLPGDPLPFETAFGRNQPDDANASAQRAEALDREDALEAIESLVVNPSPDPKAPSNSGSSVTDEDEASPSEDEEAQAALQAPPNAPLVKVPAALFEGVEAPIEDPDGHMAAFYTSLEATALREGKTRVGHWGDSVIGADGITHMARRLLQKTFGDAGRGFVMVDGDSEWYRQKDVLWTSKGWRTGNVIKRGAKDGRYGYGGVTAFGYAGAWATYATKPESPVGQRVSQFRIFASKAPRQGRLELRLDGEKTGAIEMSAEVATDVVEVVEVTDGPHKLKIRVLGGAVRLFGVSMERDEPGVIYDGIGMVGARLKRLRNFDREHLKRQLDFASTDMIALMFGGNSLADSTSLERYEEGFRGGVQVFREARPQATCLIISPVDHGVKIRRRPRTPQRLIDMMAIQRRIAREEGCAYWSAYDAMGGRDSMESWVKRDLASGDYAHLTRKGSIVMGELYFKALMKGFAAWLEEHGRRQSPGQ